MSAGTYLLSRSQCVWGLFCQFSVCVLSTHKDNTPLCSLEDYEVKRDCAMHLSDDLFVQHFPNLQSLSALHMVKQAQKAMVSRWQMQKSRKGRGKAGGKGKVAKGLTMGCTLEARVQGRHGQAEECSSQAVHWGQAKTPSTASRIIPNTNACTLWEWDDKKVECFHQQSSEVTPMMCAYFIETHTHDGAMCVEHGRFVRCDRGSHRVHV